MRLVALGILAFVLMGADFPSVFYLKCEMVELPAPCPECPNCEICPTPEPPIECCYPEGCQEAADNWPECPCTYNVECQPETKEMRFINGDTWMTYSGKIMGTYL